MAQKLKKGYLLMELMIAIVLVTVSGVILGYLQGNLMMWHRAAINQLKVVVIADQILQKEGTVTQEEDVMISIKTAHPFAHIPFKMRTTQITIKEHGKTQTYQFQGGLFDYHACQKGHHAH